MSNTQQTTQVALQQKAQPSRPNEQGTISVQAHMRIFDPKTQQVFVEGRA